MTIVVDANIAIAVLDSRHQFHQPAVRRCIEADGVAILNITRAEALIYPSRLGKLEEATAVLDQLGINIEVLDNGVADRARELRAEYGNRNFPMVDAVVVALGIERSWTVVTYDTKWPEIDDAEIEILGDR
ncbi:PIN domain-containing protein [Candidatus Poriferisocius sp.]|uniref:PIN domain-containing protein n=1 Tax=Candidatus Poriferisocius sp. TaxID=3101276 RepID=UPI003B02D26A